MLRDFLLVFGVLFPGIILMLMSVCGVLVTLMRSEDYRLALALAIVFMILSNICFGVLLRQRFLPWKVCALLAWLPSLFVLAEVARRAPFVFLQ